MGIHRDLHDMYEAGFATYVTTTTAAQTITCGKWGEVFEVTTTGSADPLTLARPTKPGLECTVVLSVDGGDLALTVTGGYNFDGTTAITFGDAKDAVVFKSVQTGSTFQWMAIAQEGTNAAIEDITADTATIADLTATSLKLGVDATVNAAGGAISNSGALSAGLNVVASADNTLSVILPVAEAGMVVLVRSTVNSKTLPVFPQVNSQINALGANSAMTLYQSAVGAAAIFVASSAILWHSFEAEDGS